MAQGQPHEGQTLIDFIKSEATAAGIDPALALAVAEQESSFNPAAIGPRLPDGQQAVGLFQILPSTAKGLGVDPNDPIQNIRGGTKYLRQLLDKHQGDPQKVLAEYGGVVRNQTYVPEVLAKIQKYASGTGPPPTTTAGRTTPPPQPRTTAGRIANVEPRPGIVSQLVSGMAASLDPRTAPGRRNLAGAGGALAAGLLTGGVGLPAAAAAVAGAGLGGAAAETGEQLVGGGELSPAAIAAAGGEQALMETIGGAVAWPFKQGGRHLLGTRVARQAKEALGGLREATARELDEVLTAAQTTVSNLRSRFAAQAPAVSASQAGRMAEQAIQGPAKTALGELGEQVEVAASQGPALATAPLQARLAELSEQITPAVAHQPAEMTVGGVAVPTKLAKEIANELGLPPEHPLPGVLKKVEGMLTEQSEISYADAHKIKRMVDDAVNWDRTAKRQAEQVTKGFRQTLRQEMASHEPYNAATAAYESTVKLHRKGLAPQLHKAAFENPESLIRGIKGNEPTKLKILQSLLLSEAPRGGGAGQGEAAWNAVRASWTFEKLTKGPIEKLDDRIAKLDPEFVQTMYGDAQGQTVLKNLQQLGTAFKDAVARADAADVAIKAAKAPTATEIALGKSTVSRTTSPVGNYGDLAYFLTSPGSPWGIRAAIRTLTAPSGKELIQWASYSDVVTRGLVRALSSPLPGTAVADLLRSTGIANRPLESARPLLERTQPPPQPMAAH